MPTIQTGRHTVTVKSADVGESKKKGTPGVFFTFRDERGDEIEGTLWLTETASASGVTPLERSLETLRLAFAFNDDFSTLSDQCTGKQCSITVEEEADEKGKFWPRVKWINALRGSSSAPAGKSLLASLTAKAKKIAKPADMPKPTAAKAPAPTDDGDPY